MVTRKKEAAESLICELECIYGRTIFRGNNITYASLGGGRNDKNTIKVEKRTNKRSGNIYYIASAPTGRLLQPTSGIKSFGFSLPPRVPCTSVQMEHESSTLVVYQNNTCHHYILLFQHYILTT